MLKASRSMIDTGGTAPWSEGTLSAYHAIRRTAVSASIPRSIIVLDGSDAFDFLHRMSTNDFRTIGDGQSRRTVIVNEKGRVVDLVTVVRTGGRTIVLGGAGSSGPLAAWFERFIIMDDVKVSLFADLPVIPALYGPDAHGSICLEPGAGIVVREDLGRIPGYLVLPATLLTGPTPAEQAADFSNVKPIDLSTLEVVRIEEQVPAIGRELGPDVNALEAGLKPFISFSKGCYIGQEVIARLDTYKKLRTIIAQFSIDAGSERAPSPGPLLQEGREAGRITSTAYSPLHRGWIGLGFREIRSDDAGFDLSQGDGGTPAHATCISTIPPGYEEYEIER
jgi:folate-binding protein YgfZ